MTGDPFTGHTGRVDAIESYEAELAERFGAAHAVAVASGTAALHTALAITGIGRGDEVLVPAMSVVMSIAPIIYLGARPVFVDCDPTGTDFDYDDLAAKIGPASRAVMPVYLWGRAGDPARLASIAATHDLTVVEDACQALGSRVQDRQIGTHGTIGCYSTHASKILATGEGGFLLTDDPHLAAHARAFRSHWQHPPHGEQPLSRVAHNYRLAAPLAAIGSARLAHFPHSLARRREQADLLNRLLSDVPGVVPVPTRTGEEWNGYACLRRVHLPDSRAFLRHLAAHGVPNSVGTFGLTAADQRVVFATPGAQKCTTTAQVLDSLLAVVLTEQDDDDRLRHYARTIAKEAAQWASA